jgi:hypothetical protein
MELPRRIHVVGGFALTVCALSPSAVWTGSGESTVRDELGL